MNDFSPPIAEKLLRPAPALIAHGRGESRIGVQGTRSAVFLHTGWRSGGTWIWSRCREAADVRGFYEPLNEQMGRLRRRDVATMRPGSWHSNHSDTPPYFEEYRDLIPPRGRGVALYQERFAFERFFRDPNDGPDHDLEAYLHSLIAGASAAGRLPVLKFCRSLGRVGWFEQRFPRALHAVVVRDPAAQFHSAQTLLTEQRNRYFAVAPLLVLAKNAQHPAVRQAASALGVHLPTLYSDDMSYGVETCWLHARRQGAAERYRTFLAFWTVCTLSALESDAMVIDMDAIRSNPEHRHQVEAALRSRIGDTVSLVPRSASPAPDERALRAAMNEAHHAATALALAHRARLTPGRLDLILAKLDASGDTQDAPARLGVLMPRWQTPDLPAPIGQRNGLQRLTTAASVLAARALQPLRRLHGQIVSRR